MDMAPDYIVEVRDKNFTRVGQVAPEFLDLKFNEVFRSVGAWEMKLPAEHPLLETLKTKGSGIIITQRASDYVFSGRMQSCVLSQDAADPKGTWVIRGVDDNVLGAAVAVLPDPTHAADAQTTDYWNFAGSGEAVMKAAVSLNAGSEAIAARRYSWLSVAANANRGDTVSASVRFQQLGDMLTSVGIKAGLGWRFAQQGDTIVFDVYEPADKSQLVQLDIRNGGLNSTELGFSAPAATQAFVMGQGQGADRTVRVVSSPEAAAEATEWGLRWEVVKDQRNTDEPTELQQAGEEILTEKGATVHSLKVSPGDVPNQRLGVDWGLGDVVTVVIDGSPATAIVTEIATSISSAGVIRQATVGDPVGFDWEAKVSSNLKAQDTRISTLERLVDSGVNWDGITGKPTTFPPSLHTHPASAITSGVFDLARIPHSDTGWITITSGFLAGFHNNGTAGKLQYRIRDGVVYWRGGADGVFPSGAYTRFVEGLPAAASPDSFIRFGGTGSGANPTFIEFSPLGYLNAAQSAGSNRAWVDFTISFPQS